MQSDQQTINQLSQEGLLSPNQAIYLDNKAYNRANGSWWNNHTAPAWSGSSMLGGYPTAVGAIPGNVFTSGIPLAQNFSQVHKEDKQIEKLERDGVISRGQGNMLKSQINYQSNIYAMNGMRARFANQSCNNGLVPAGYSTAGLMPATPANYFGGYSGQGSPLWSQVRNYFH
jgi:hypothetical protein